MMFITRFRGQLYGLGSNHTKYKGGGKSYTNGERTTNGGNSTSQGD